MVTQPRSAQPPGPAASMPTSYSPQIDSLRAIAVFGVLFQHWTQVSRLGTWGVTLFFVISGFLITRQIMELRESGAPLGEAAGTFFLRRTLRLFPAYYLVLGLAFCVFEMKSVVEDWLWYVSYLSNVLFWIQGKFNPLTPTWSLAVEEQFYLLWFFVCMWLGPDRISRACFALLALAPLSRTYFQAVDAPFGGFLLWSNCDALAVGALLWLRETHRVSVDERKTNLPFLACLLALIPIAAQGNSSQFWGAPLETTLVALASAAAVWRARTGFQGWPGRLLELRPLVYLGKISYGIYLYHMLAPTIGHLVSRKLPGAWHVTGTFAFHCVLSVSMAALSYHLMELPIRRLARRRAVASKH